MSRPDPRGVAASGRAGSADPETWVLGGDAAVRREALIRLGGRAPDDPEVAAARAELMRAGPVADILAAQGPDGHWQPREHFYRKYTGSAWQLLILAELGADGRDERVRAGCEAVLRDAQHLESGGFSTAHGKRAGGGRSSSVIPCLTGNLLFALLRLGLGGDPRVERAVEWITTYRRFDDSDGEPPTGWPYDALEMCWGRHTCSMGVVKAMKGLAEIPADHRSPAVEDTLARGAEFILRHHVHQRSHDLGRVSKPSWKRFGFPLMYQTDALEILLLLVRLGYADQRMREALDLVVAKADADGRWRLDDSMNDRFIVPVEDKGRPSRWVTLRALEVLRSPAATFGASA